MFKYFRQAWKEAREIAKKNKELDAQKQRLLDKNMDYMFLEHIIQKINENPLLKIRVILNDGTVMDINCTPERKKLGLDLAPEPYEDYMEVKAR